MWRSNCEGHAVFKENLHIHNSSGLIAELFTVRSVLHRVLSWVSWGRNVVVPAGAGCLAGTSPRIVTTQSLGGCSSGVLV